jgi:hypothetical protein
MPWRNAGHVPAGIALIDATPAGAIADAASFQKYSECFRPSSGLLGSHLDIVSRSSLLEVTIMMNRMANWIADYEQIRGEREDIG